MGLTFFDYEIPLLTTLIMLGGSAKTSDVYPLLEKVMKDTLKVHPEEYGHYKIQADIIWKNKTQWAREYLKRKGQLDGSVRGVWSITDAGRERLRLYEQTGKDLDEGRATIEGIESSIANTGGEPEKIFNKFDNFHETGAILNVRGIVYEPINEQGVVLLFAAIAHEIGFLIEGVRTKFPDALLRRKTDKGTFKPCFAEFEFKASNYFMHGHPKDGADLLICWDNDWKEAPLEVLELKEIIKKFKNN